MLFRIFSFQQFNQASSPKHRRTPFSLLLDTMAPLFDEAEARNFYLELSRLMTVRALTAQDPLDPALDSVEVRDIWDNIYALVNLMNDDPEMTKYPVSEGTRIGNLLWKYTMLLHQFRTQCEDETRRQVENCRSYVVELLAKAENQEVREEKEREIVFFNAILDHYKA